MVLLDKSQVQARLTAAGAFWWAQQDDLHEVWGTPWMFYLWVPIAAPLSVMYDREVDGIVLDIQASKP